ncbi:trichohyalin, partial [Synchiropus splendidus]|uniref:trichohyalin n=1 Tax=Synchiropus splendidus TaxID=270530 RepID=UPI00237E772A
LRPSRPPSASRPSAGGALLPSPAPSVSRALHHVQELRAKVLSGCRQPGRQAAGFHGATERCGPALSQRLHTKCPNSDSLTWTQLFVQGIAISTQGSCPLSTVVKEIKHVLEEVVYLLERLEADRQRAEDSLLREKRKKLFLETQLQRISARKCGSTIEKEKDTSNKDISDLKWQIKCASAALEQVGGALSDTKVLNQRFHQDVHCAREQLVNLKAQLDVQERLIQDVTRQQAEADEEHCRVQSHLLAAKEEMKKLEQQTNKEKDWMSEELLLLKTALDAQVTQLQQLEEQERHLSAEIKEAETTVATSEEKCVALEKDIPEMEVLETEQKRQISRLKRRVEDEAQLNRRLEEELAVLWQKLEESKQEGEAEVALVREQLWSKRSAHAALRTQHLEDERMVEENKMKISQSEKAVEQMLEQREQMLQKISHNDEQLGRAREEVTRGLARLRVSRAELQEQERRRGLREQRAGEELESLRRERRRREALRRLLQGQCAQISHQLQEQQRSSDLVLRKLKEEFEDVHSATESLEARLEELKKQRSQVERVESEHKEELAQLRREQQLKLERLSAVKAIEAASALRYEQVLSQITGLQRETEQLRQASARAQDDLGAMPEVIARLQRALGAAEFTDGSAALLLSTLRSDISRCQRGRQRSVRRHAAQVAGRTTRAGQAKEALALALEEKKRLAAEHEELKKLLSKHRQQTVRVLSESNHAHQSLQYYTQLSLLQKRMHKALVKHSRRHGLHMPWELDGCQSLSGETLEQRAPAAQDLVLLALCCADAVVEESALTPAALQQDSLGFSGALHLWLPLPASLFLRASNCKPTNSLLQANSPTEMFRGNAAPVTPRSQITFAES